MKLVTPAEFSRIAGVSRQAIGKAVKLGGSLRYYPDTKKIDVEDQLAQTYIADQKLLKKRGVSTTAASKPAASSTASWQKKSPSDLSDPDVIDKLAERKAIADTRKAEGAVVRQQLLTDKDRGILIERDLVSHVLSKLYIIDSNELRPLNDKMAPMICSELEIDDPVKILAVNKIIEKEIFKTLAHIQRQLDEFLVKIQAEPLSKQPALEPVTQN